MSDQISTCMCNYLSASVMCLVLVLAGGGEAQGAAAKECGTKRLYGRSLPLLVRGQPVSCARVRHIVGGRCDAGKRWSCFSLRPPDPLLIWFKERERFRRRYSTVVEARRYPCAQARVTRAAWRRAYQRLRGFPTRAQLFADDILRCHLLAGWSRQRVIHLLGKPYEHGGHYIEYVIGDERDSFFQIDSELLALGFRG